MHFEAKPLRLGAGEPGSLATTYALDGRTLGLWATKAKEGLLLLQCWNACFCIGLEQGLKSVELATLL
jgi:hypothetical protein